MTEITLAEAHDRILFLSAGYAMTTQEITDRWPDWHAKHDRARKAGVDSAEFLLWKCRFAKPAYAAIANAERLGEHAASNCGDAPDMLDALEAATKALGMAAGTALGVAISGKAHPNLEEVLTDVFNTCNVADKLVRAAIAKAEGRA